MKHDDNLRVISIACSSELSITARASSGQVRKNNAWCAGRNSDKFQWIVVDLDGEKKISGIVVYSWFQRNLSTLWFIVRKRSWFPLKETSARF